MLARYDCSKRKSGIGGKSRRRGRGWITSLGIVDEEVSEANECERERCGESEGDSSVAGIFLDAAVDGFRSWCGDGLRFMDTD